MIIIRQYVKLSNASSSPMSLTVNSGTQLDSKELGYLKLPPKNNYIKFSTSKVYKLQL